MTALERVLFVGWIGFLAVSLPLYAWQVLRDHRARRALPPRRHLLQRLALLGGNAVWLALIGLSGGVSLPSLALFAICLIPPSAIALATGYRLDKSRYECFRNQGREGSPGDR